MKIIQVIPAFVLGGAETMCANLSVELKRQGHDVQVISLYRIESPITEKLKKSGIDVVFLDKKTGFDVSLIIRLKWFFSINKPDVVHTHLYACKYAQIAAFLAGIKCKIHTIHSLANHSDGKVSRCVNYWLFHMIDVVPISLSDEVQKTVMNAYKLKNYQTPIVLNGVPIEKCRPLEEYNTKATKFLHVGRFATPKNHSQLIEAFSCAHHEHEDIELFLYGEGELIQEAKDLVSKLRAEKFIHFCGTTNDVYTVMSDADVFILPSLWEGIPMTLIEAMGTGLPIIASNVGGIPNMLVDNVSGILIKPSVDEISTAIKQIVLNKELRQKIGRNALNQSVGFSAVRMAHCYTDVYATKVN